MKSKKIVIILSALACILVSATSYIPMKTAGPHPGSTGAPGDKTCSYSGCHVTPFVVSNDTTVNKLIFPNADSTYIPGQTYSITLKVQNPNILKFGFELVAIKDADSTNTGQIIITDPVRTQDLGYVAVMGPRTSVAHKTAGTSAISTGFTQWTFDWTAPATNEGTITFYYATNCTNNNNAASGDKIYLSSFKIKPSANISVQEYINESNINAFYDIETNKLVLSYYLKTGKQVSVDVADNSGRRVFSSSGRLKAQGPQKEEIPLAENVSKGVYFVTVMMDNKKITKKIIVQ